MRRDVEANLVMARNLATAMCAYSRASDGGEFVEMDGMTLVNSGIDYAVFNAALFVDPVLDYQTLSDCVSAAAVYYESRGVGWSCWVAEELIDSRLKEAVTSLMRRHRLWMVAEHRGMIAEGLKPPHGSIPKMEVRQVRDEATRADFAHVCAQVFSMPGGLAHDVYGHPRFWEGRFQAWLGYVEGRAVTTAAVQPGSGVLGLYSVGTLPEEQRRGYGEAITRAALERAAETAGTGRTILQATTAGVRLYKKLGYRMLGRIAVYATS